MKITNLIAAADPRYQGLYGINYFGPVESHGNLFRPEDQWPALCYAHGIYTVHEFAHAVCDQREDWLALISQQLEFLRLNHTRTPCSVLEIGSGSGQISCTLSHLGMQVQTVDVNPHAEEFHRARAADMYNNQIGADYHLLLGDLNSVSHCLDLQRVDTVLLIETIEHIYNAEWQQFLQQHQPLFALNHTHLVITNFQDLWPIHGVDGQEHCNTIDDDFYDQLALQAARVVLRDRAHLVLEF